MTFTKEGKAQCISSFPYSEGFETSPAWTASGTNSDWAWGSPSHPNISSAGGGVNCWSVGGLAGTFYNYGELSWLMSPCFDFTTLNYPWISLKIFWETEWHWDGVVFQYSIDGGFTWSNVGTYGSPVDCLNDNWYNHDDIYWLNSISKKEGWSGRVGATVGSCLGGNGSGAWVTVKQCLNGLAGRPNVIFRFFFGSGQTCNDYDGIAVDDILIEDTPPNTANFSHTCINNNTVMFTNQSTPCPSAFAWNFGDPNSGTSNTSALENPSHTFSAPGTFNVTLTSTGPCNAPGSITIPVTVISINTTSANVTCNGAANGSILTTVTGSGGPFNYNWTPSGQTTPGIAGLFPGSYSVTASAPGSCPANSTVIITEPTTLLVNVPSADVCSGENLFLNANVSGGTPGYSFLWDTGQNDNPLSLSPTATSTYKVTITDKNGCTDSASANVVVYPLPAIIASSDTTIVVGSNVILTASGGGVHFLWSPSTWLSCDTCSSTVAAPWETTDYIVTTIDNFGCRNEDTVTVHVDDDLTLYVPNAFVPEHGNFYAYGIGIRYFEFYIFNRWGKLIFESTDPYKGWDGTDKGIPVQQDVYVYLARAISITGLSITKTGSLTVLK